MARGGFTEFMRERAEAQRREKEDAALLRKADEARAEGYAPATEVSEWLDKLKHQLGDYQLDNVVEIPVGESQHEASTFRITAVHDDSFDMQLKPGQEFKTQLDSLLADLKVEQLVDLLLHVDRLEARLMVLERQVGSRLQSAEARSPQPIVGSGGPFVDINNVLAKREKAAQVEAAQDWLAHCAGVPRAK